MINSVVIDGFVGDGYKNIVLGNGTEVVEFTLICYIENQKNKYQRISCKTVSKMTQFFNLNVDNIVNHRVVICGSVRSLPNGANYVLVDGIGMRSGVINVFAQKRNEKPGDDLIDRTANYGETLEVEDDEEVPF